MKTATRIACTVAMLLGAVAPAPWAHGEGDTPRGDKKVSGETKRCQEPFLLTQGVGEARLAPHGASVTYRCRRRDLSRIEPG